MPLYDIRCSRSNQVFERHIKLANFEEPIFCACGATAHRCISTPMFSVDNTGYDCPVTGKWIGSKREHEENLRQTNCRVLETGEREANAKKREAEEAAFEKSVENTVERTIEAMPSEKREKLYNEMVHSDLEIARS
jgi:hypothetical protein